MGWPKPFNKEGISQSRIQKEGSDYVRREFPNIDFWRGCHVAVRRNPSRAAAEAHARAQAVLMAPPTHSATLRFEAIDEAPLNLRAAQAVAQRLCVLCVLRGSNRVAVSGGTVREPGRIVSRKA